jgi:hypothetical protein
MFRSLHKMIVRNTSLESGWKSVLIVIIIFLSLPLFCCSNDSGPQIDSIKINLIIAPDSNKIRDVQSGKQKVANAVWWGFDGTNSTAMLQAAIRSGAKKVIIPKLEVPWTMEPVFLVSEQELFFEEGTKVIAKSGAFRGINDSFFSAVDKHDITIQGYGAEFFMLKEDYSRSDYPRSEWRNCISLKGCRSINIFGIHVSNSGGDGIYIGRGNDSTYCYDIHIKDVVSDNNYRQGISIISAQKLLVENCSFNNTKGTLPQAGIDFEPNRPDERLIDCIFYNCNATQNIGFGIQLALFNLNVTSLPISITIDSCTMRSNRSGSLGIYGPTIDKGRLGYIQFIGNLFEKPTYIEPFHSIEIRTK